MNLDDIPGGSLCVVDTSVLLYSEQGVSTQAQRLLRRIERREVIGVVPQPVWQELTHKLMLAEAMMLGQISGGNPARQLAAKPDVIKRLTIYRDKLSALITLGIAFEVCTKNRLARPGPSATRALWSDDERLCYCCGSHPPRSRCLGFSRRKIQSRKGSACLCSLGFEDGLQ